MANYRKELGRKMTPSEQKISRKESLKRYSLSERGKITSKKSQDAWYARTKGAIFGALGCMCNKCGFSDMRALQIDHINGDGAKHRAETGAANSYYASILKSILAGEKKYQILCANCNWIKKEENNEKRPIIWNK